MEQESLVQNKVLLLECFVAESKLAMFLFDCMDKYASGLDLQETLKAKELVNNVYGLLQRIKVSADESPPPDKLPVYRIIHRNRSRYSQYPRAATIFLRNVSNPPRNL